MKKFKKEYAMVQAAAIALISLVYFGLRSLPVEKAVHEKGGFYYVERAIDGDTLKLSNRQRVRLIGVDTPEVYYSEKLLKDSKRSGRDIETIRSLGKRASDFTKSLCNNKKVRLEFDADKRDRYGRILAYVYLEDGTFVNASIIKEGYGQVLTVPPNVKHAKYFAQLQREARDSGRGLWSAGMVLEER